MPLSVELAQTYQIYCVKSHKGIEIMATVGSRSLKFNLVWSRRGRGKENLLCADKCEQKIGIIHQILHSLDWCEKMGQNLSKLVF